MASVRPRPNSLSTTSSSSAQQQARHDNKLSMDMVTTSAAAHQTKAGTPARPGAKLASFVRSSIPGADVVKPKNTTCTIVPDLIDLEIGKEATVQPVLSFTRSQEDAPQATSAGSREMPMDETMKHLHALEVSRLLTKQQLDMLRSITNDVQARNMAKSKVTVESKNETKSIVAAKSTPTAVVTMPEDEDQAQTGMQIVNPFQAGVVQLRPSNSKEARRSLAQQLSEQRKSLIGEHVHRSRFQTSLIEDFETLTLSDNLSSDTSTTLSESASTEAAFTEPEFFRYPKDNPFGPAKKKSGISLPPHLRDQKPPADAGAAVRAQYGLAEFSAPVSDKPRSKLPSAKAAVPTLSHLRAENSTDPGAAASVQCGSGAVPARGSKKQRQGATSNDTIKPSQTAHLRVQTVNDTAAAVATVTCGKDINALSTISNRQPHSPASAIAKAENTEASQAPARSSRFNQSGFYGLAARAREASKAD